MAAFTSDERQLLHESLVEYFKANYPFERFRELTDRQHPDGSSREAWAEYASLGWLGVALPENAGGSAGGMTELAIVMSAAGGALALEPFLPTLVPCFSLRPRERGVLDAARLIELYGEANPLQHAESVLSTT